MNKIDKIMNLAYEFAEVKAQHAIAVREFSNDRADYDAIPPLSAAWVKAENTLRAAVSDLQADYNELVAGVRGIVDAWEGGDLAGAVNEAAGLLPEED